MSLSCGLVGLPNVGKSTLFNAILKKAKAEAANYPFCTIEPNVGQVAIDDPRLEILSKISETDVIVPAVLDCTDIAGLVKGAYKGEGLGNQFLGHIRECDLIIQVLRCFADEDVMHVEGEIDPVRDYDIINLELQFSDIERLDKFLEQKKNNDPKLKKIAQKAKEYLQSNYFLNTCEWDEEERLFFDKYGMLTHKPMIIVANIQQPSDDIFVQKIAHLNPIKVNASFELMLQEVEDENEKLALLKEAGLEESGLAMILQRAYKDLGLISFFTAGKKEVRAWKVCKGQTMQDAAGVIHTDFYKGFISAEVIKYEDFVSANGWNGAREKGLIKTCSKTTLVEDGDVCLFKTYN
jgi:GTP-binding protein YchF